MKRLIAHSANNIVEAQPYETHVLNGIAKAKEIIVGLKPFLSNSDYTLLESLVIGAFCVHDMGKLCPYSQKILWNEQKGKMPNHVDAGTAYLLDLGNRANRLKAWIVKCHHWGFDKFHETKYNDGLFRDPNILQERCPWIRLKGRMYEYTDSILNQLVSHQKALVPSTEQLITNVATENATGTLLRLALATHTCADHFDTASNYQNVVVEENTPLHPKKRLDQLDKYIKELGKNKPDPIKDKIYLACRNSRTNSPLVHCKSEVGTGKTTAIMAYALKRCIKSNLRRIIYVAPYTNIISQTVEVYRKALVLEGENECETVAEHHHQVDFLDEVKKEYDKSGKKLFDPDDPKDRAKISYLHKYTTDWHAPIVCTTAVQFFETLAATGTSKLKKLSQLPGSVIIIDETHAALPPNLWPMTLIWFKELIKLGCIIVLASGSMILPWQNEQITEITKYKPTVPSIIPKVLSEETLEREKNRVAIEYNQTCFKTPRQFCEWVATYKGPKVVVCNTINNAARIAACFEDLYGDGTEKYAMHMSTSLTPADREQKLERIKTRLQDKTKDWVLVATSCIEAGLDISFQYGFRENSSLMSVLQLAGRVSRNKEYKEPQLVVFDLECEDTNIASVFNHNSESNKSRKVFIDLYQKFGKKLGPEHCEKAFNLELQSGLEEIHARYDPNKKPINAEEMLELESRMELKQVDLHYNVINQDKRTVIIPDQLDIDLLNSGKLSITEIVRHSVQIYETKLERYPVEQSSDDSNLWIWNGEYDTFLGYMAHFISRRLRAPR